MIDLLFAYIVLANDLNTAVAVVVQTFAVLPIVSVSGIAAGC